MRQVQNLVSRMKYLEHSGGIHEVTPSTSTSDIVASRLVNPRSPKQSSFAPVINVLDYDIPEFRVQHTGKAGVNAAAGAQLDAKAAREKVARAVEATAAAKVKAKVEEMAEQDEGIPISRMRHKRDISVSATEKRAAERRALVRVSMVARDMDEQNRTLHIYPDTEDEEEEEEEEEVVEIEQPTRADSAIAIAASNNPPAAEKFTLIMQYFTSDLSNDEIISGAPCNIDGLKLLQLRVTMTSQDVFNAVNEKQGADTVKLDQLHRRFGKSFDVVAKEHGVSVWEIKEAFNKCSTVSKARRTGWKWPEESKEKKSAFEVARRAGLTVTAQGEGVNGCEGGRKRKAEEDGGGRKKPKNG